MPIYTFECDNCGAERELLAALGHDSEFCPECGELMRMTFNPFTIRGFPSVPENHLPKELGGTYDRNSGYWRS